jgi:hypothetical protein
MQRLIALLAVFSLYAADAWQSKPFTDWTDKDVQKILTSSPWAHSVSISVGAGMVDNPLTGRQEPGNHPGGMNSSTGPGVMAPNGQEGGHDSRGGFPDATTVDRQSIALMVVWQSALPVKQALARRRFGAEAVGSVDAKKFLDENPGYLIGVSGLTPELLRAVQAKPEILQRTTLSVKGKEPLHASDILVSPPGKATEAVFVFPKTTAFAVDDKDVEFSTQLGTSVVKNRFHLKDMVVNGTLQL